MQKLIRNSIRQNIWLLAFYLFMASGLIITSKTNGQAYITIDLIPTSYDTIKPYIYGGFIEFIGSTINGKSGLWAQEIDYRGLEVPDSNGDGVTEGWYPINTTNNSVSFAQDTMRFNRNGQYSQKIDVVPYLDGRIGIGQSDMNFQSREQYAVDLYMKGTGIEGGVTVWLIQDTTQWEGCDSLTFYGIGETWTKFSGTLTPATTTDNGTFAVTFEEQGTLYIDEVSLMPLSAVDGVRKTYFDLTTTLKPNIMRYPGGSFADGEGNHWINGVGDIDQRPPNWDNYFEAWQRMDFGTDEFVHFCQNTNMDPQMTVNFGSGTPKEAADWVEYTNGDIGTAYGNLRSSNGHPAPYNIVYWEIGNEQYRDEAIGHISAEEYATRFIEFTQQMKARDPSIKVMANGCRYKQSWNDTVLAIAGEAMDYITVHLTCPDLSDSASGHTDEEIYKAVVAGPLKHEAFIDQLKRAIDGFTPGNIKIAATECWMTYGRNPLYAEHGQSLESALYLAGMLNLFQNIPELLDIANWTTAGKIKYSHLSNDYYRTGQFLVLSLYSNHNGVVPLASTVDCSTYTSPRIGSFPQMNSVPYLDVSATRSDDKIYINTVNRSFQEINATIQTVGEILEPDAIILTINGPDFLSSNMEPPHESITLQESTIQGITDNFTYTFPGHSVTGMELAVAGSGIKTKGTSSVKYSLKNAYPNPFNTSTCLVYQLPVQSNVSLKIIDITGRNVRILVNKNQPAGCHTVRWYGENHRGEKVSTGVYFYQLKIDDTFSQAKKILYLR